MEVLKKNDIYECEVSGSTSEGHGVCRIAGRAVFVPRALPGELWRVRVIKVTAGAAYGRGEELLRPSPDRCEPACPAYGRCGGCSMMHMSYEAELRMKLSRVNDALRRIGGLDIEAGAILPAAEPLRYRNKAIFAIAGTPDGPAFGFYRRGSHDLVPVTYCLLQPGEASACAAAVCGFMREHSIPAYDPASGRGAVRHVFVRRARDGRAVCCVVSASGLGAATAELPAYLRSRCPSLTGVVLNINRSRGNTVLAGDFYTLWGQAELRDTLCGFSFDLSPQSFFQINPPQAEKLYDIAVDHAAPPGTGTVLDLYCGAGTISLCLARGAEHVIGAEIVPEAVENARANAAANGVTNAEFICADAGEAAAELARRGLRPEAVTVDPPRKGMSREAVLAVCSMSPQRIAYVSCDPATLARDLAVFAQNGYTPISATAVDMFPRTEHVETVVLLSKGEIDSKKVRVEFSLEDMDMSGFQKDATYPQIKERVLQQTGLKVSSLYIAQVKQKYGITERENYNKPKAENSRQPKCPPEKEAAIVDALRHFGLVPDGNYTQLMI